MKLFILMLLASFLATTSFAQKAKAFEKKQTGPTTIVIGGNSSSLSLKEQMKRNVLKINTPSAYYVSLIDQVAFCPLCKVQIEVSRVGSKHGEKVYTCARHTGMVCKKGEKCQMCKS